MSTSDTVVREQARADAVRILEYQYRRRWREAERFEQRRARIAEARLTPRQLREYLTARARALKDWEVHTMGAARAGCSPRRDWINDVA